MPIHSGKDKQGSFYQWGKTGKKYYYVSSNEESRKRAYKKAQAQQIAIYSSGYKGDSEMKKPTMKLVNVIVKRKDSKPAKKSFKKVTKRISKKDWDDLSPEDIARANKFWEESGSKMLKWLDGFDKLLNADMTEIKTFSGKVIKCMDDIDRESNGNFEVIFEDLDIEKKWKSVRDKLQSFQKLLAGIEREF